MGNAIQFWAILFFMVSIAYQVFAGWRDMKILHREEGFELASRRVMEAERRMTESEKRYQESVAFREGMIKENDRLWKVIAGHEAEKLGKANRKSARK